MGERENVAYSGEPGAFAEDALIDFFGDAVTRLPVGSFGDVREAVLDGRAQFGILPIENLVNGTVRETLDLVRDGALEIVGESVVPVNLVLAALPGVALDDITRVYSHAQALAQSEPFLRTRNWQLLSTYNTAGAGAAIRDRSERDAAAVLSPRAAKLHGLVELASGIERDPGNRTRFWVLRRTGGAAELSARSGAPRTTLLVGVRNEPGTLLAVLQRFADAGVNMSKLESRPSQGGDWEYVFWMDLDAGVDEPALKDALHALKAVTSELRILGSYPRGAAL
ncbi:MAG: prephenate dehydratase [Candidatus Limnocylindrus sp.]|jgi:prephenate dehydratase